MFTAQPKPCPENLPIVETYILSTAAPNWIELFNEITRYVSDLRSSGVSEPASKKRKIEEAGLPINTVSNGTNGYTRTDTAALASKDEGPVLLQIKDISLVIPQRKKYILEFTSTHLRARLPDGKEPVPITYAWKDIGSSHRSSASYSCQVV